MGFTMCPTWSGYTAPAGWSTASPGTVFADTDCNHVLAIDNPSETSLENQNGPDSIADAARICTGFATFRGKMPDEFCQFTDAACKQKLQEKMEDDMAVVAWVGAVFCVVFAGILYGTYRGILVYMGGDDDE